MQRTGHIISIVLIILFASSCSKMNPGDCFKNNGSVTTEVREIGSYSYLNLQNNVDVFLTYDPEFSVVVRAGENIIQGIKTQLSGETLTISNENTCNWIRSYDSPIEVYLGLPQIDSIVYQSSGNLTSLNEFTGETIKLDVLEGGGSINLWLNMTRSSMNLHYGTVDLTLKGYSHIVYLYSGGYGPADLSDLNTEFTYMTNNSTNICRVRANNTLQVKIPNVGDVYYSGDPLEILTEITGTGRLYKEQ